MPALKRPDWYKADMNPDEMGACLVKNLHVRVDADLATTLAQRYQNDFCNEIGNEMLDLVIKYGHVHSRAQTVGRRIIKKNPNGWGFRGTCRRERETPGTTTEARDALWKTN
jgi:hypothetical protein